MKKHLEDVTVDVEINADLNKKIEEHARRENMTYEEVVNYIIEQYLDNLSK